MWQQVVIALALVLVIEGIAPALGPRAYRRVLRNVAQVGDAQLRLLGLASMTAGALLIYWLA